MTWKIHLSWLLGGAVAPLAIWGSVAYLWPASEAPQAAPAAAESTPAEPSVPVSVPLAWRLPVVVLEPPSEPPKLAQASAPEAPPAVAPTRSRCAKYAYRVPPPKAGGLFDDMTSKYKFAYEASNRRMAALLKCLRDDQPGRWG